MHIKGALHIHSILSHDGTMAIPELAEWFAGKGYQFVAMGEHAEDMNAEKVQTLLEQSAANSRNGFCVVPGLEFICRGGIHLVGLGVERLIAEKEAVAVARQMRQSGGFVVLAHPRRIKWQCPAEVLQEVDAAEIWNIGYDGKYLPSAQAFDGFERMRRVNPKLLAVAGHDFHKKQAFYEVAVEMDVDRLAPMAILENLRAGRYAIRSPFFDTDAHAQISSAKATSLGMVSRQLKRLRQWTARFRR
jgi:predicted metal-dependent phosphoesterase TrpH